jgi:ketosteroid isomerase-like protein
MSDTTNLEIVRSGYEKFGSGDIPGLLKLFSNDIKWTVPEIENAPFAGSRSGTEGVGEFFKQLSSAEDITSFEPTEFIAQRRSRRCARQVGGDRSRNRPQLQDRLATCI